MNKALIISPTGCPILSDDVSNHWRQCKPERTYETCLVLFNDFVPEPNTYDSIIKETGIKWHIIPKIAKRINWEDYDYIGCWDDD